MNIIDYVKSQMDDFDTTKFNLVDSLVLSQFAYINFNDVVPGIDAEQSHVRIADLLMAEHFKKMLHNVRYPKKNQKLLLALGMSPRFRNIRMCFFVDSLSIVEQKQFAAVTYLLDDETAYVAYRGTDTTFVGWKEDFNMAFISPIPAQQEGVSYLNAVAKRLSHRLMVGGHSKGGNIAVYSSMECHSSIQDRIVGVYTHDGPGFKDEVFSSEKYKRIKDRIHKTLPQSSLVGMLLQHQEDYLVVESKQFWFMQHDPFSWSVKKDGFIYAQGITEGAEHFNRVINQWISSIDEEKRELFVTTLYSVIESVGLVNYSDFTEDWQKKAALAIKNIRGIDKETRRFVNKTIKALLELYVKTLPKPKPLKIAEKRNR
ncbi:MAG: DUF2974 domain-containing protein [Clostridiales bacterium]|jgi:hypothetical protein|nr:DUF2974 domain-containing protein [Clostridiales bacterium]